MAGLFGNIGQYCERLAALELSVSDAAFNPHLVGSYVSCSVQLKKISLHSLEKALSKNIVHVCSNAEYTVSRSANGVPDAVVTLEKTIWSTLIFTPVRLLLGQEALKPSKSVHFRKRLQYVRALNV